MQARMSATFFIVLFIIALPFGLAEILSFGKIDFFTKHILPRLARLFALLTGKIPWPIFYVLGFVFFVWFTVMFPLVVITAAGVSWFWWFVPKVYIESVKERISANVLGRGEPREAQSSFEYIGSGLRRGVNRLRRRRSPGAQRLPVDNLGMEEVNTMAPGSYETPYDPLPNVSSSSINLAMHGSV